MVLVFSRLQIHVPSELLKITPTPCLNPKMVVFSKKAMELVDLDDNELEVIQIITMRFFTKDCNETPV